MSSMWASPHTNDILDGYYSFGGGAAVASQWHPSATSTTNSAGWWPEAYAGWYYQAHVQAAASEQSAAALQEASHRGTSSDCLLVDRRSRAEQVSTTSKIPRRSPLRQTLKPAAATPAGLSFSELESRLNTSWEHLVRKEVPKDAPQPLAMPMPSRLVTSPVTDCEPVPSPPSVPLPPPCGARFTKVDDAEKVPTASIFCPLCAEPGGACPFHTRRCWAASSAEKMSSQDPVCEAPPPSHIAHAMVDQILDTEDASTEAGSAAEGFGGSVSFSDDWSDLRSDLGDVNAVLLDQESGAWWSQRESPSEDLRSPGYSASLTVPQWPAPAASLPSRSRPPSQVNMDHLNQILAMGFPEADARQALIQTGQRGVDAAVTFLIDGVPA